MSVTVTGLRELRRELRKLEADEVWRPRLRQAGYESADIVAGEARRTARTGATTVSGTTAWMGSVAVSTIRALAGQTRATVAGGKGSLAYFGGWEFGSHGGPRTRQFPGARTGGYNIYPAVDTKRSEVLEFYSRALDAIVRDAFPD